MLILSLDREPNMLIPKTELTYSLPLNRLFLREFDHKDLTSLRTETKTFREIYEQNVPKDLRLIQRFTGFPWTKSFIPIYIVRSCPESISDPLVLRYFKNPLFMYVLLIHELVHVNLQGNNIKLDRGKLEIYVNAVVSEVLKQSTNVKKLLKAATHEKNWNKMLKSGLQLNDKTLKDILQSEQ
jgi:hypothetical protein